MIGELVGNLYRVLICHFLGDYVLQSKLLDDRKGKSWYYMFVHCCLYTLPFFVLYGYSIELPILWITHFIIDTIKARYNIITHVQDQAMHIVIAIAFYVVKSSRVLWFF